MKRILICLMFASLVAVARSPGQSAPSSQPTNSRERYNILVEKNIFVRNRPPTRTGSRPSSSGGSHRPEEYYVLTGIVLQEGRHVAFVENRSTNVTERLTPGASLLGGKVIDVQFDSLEFESNGQKSRIRIGRNFLGDVSSAPATAATPATSPAHAGAGTTGATAAAPSSTAPPAPALTNDANLSLEERMKLRRQQLSK